LFVAGRKKILNKRMDNGWVVINRNIWSGDMRDDPALKFVWITLIVWANWRDGSDRVGRQQITLSRGQLVTGRKELSINTGLTEQVVRRCLNDLEMNQRINQESTKNGTVITILNYDKYQSIENKQQPSLNQPNNQTSTNNEPTMNQTSTNNEPYINKVTNLTNGTSEPENKKKTMPRPKKVEAVSDHDNDLGQRWAEYTKAEYPFLKPKPDEYVQAIAKVRRMVGLNDEQLDYLFEFVQSDDFWKQNCQSPIGLLRKSKNGLRKIDNILAKIKAKVAPQAKLQHWAENMDKLYEEGKL